MAPDSPLPFLFLWCFLLPLSSACSESFLCGDFGEINFPFTKAMNTECGFLPIRGCDNSSAHKEVQFGNKRWLQIGNISQKGHEYEMIVHDLEFQELLDSKTCSVFDYQVPIPSESPPLSFSFLNIPLLRCSLTHYNYDNVSHHYCSDHKIIYFEPINIAGQLPTPSNGCFVIQLPLKSSISRTYLQA